MHKNFDCSYRRPSLGVKFSPSLQAVANSACYPVGLLEVFSGIYSLLFFYFLDLTGRVAKFENDIKTGVDDKLITSQVFEHASTFRMDKIALEFLD